MQVKKMPVHVVQRTLKLMDKDTDFAEFIMLKDKDAITRYCRDHHFAISFRRAGRYTVDKLQRGAAAKGHHILEKSIKEKSIDSPSLFPFIPQELRGLVGYWDSGTGKKTGIMKLKGLYLSRAGMERLNIKRRKGSQAVLLKVLLRKTGYRQDQAEDYLPEGLPEEITDKEREQLKRLYWLARMIRQDDRADRTGELQKPFTYADFVTGDYDMHDLVYIAPEKMVRSVASHPDFAVMKGLNAAMNGGRYKPRSEYDRIQHGAQSNYSYYMLGHLGEKFVVSLLNPDPPGEDIAMCGPDGRWYRISSREDLEEFYKSYGINIGPIWPEGRSLAERGSGLRSAHRKNWGIRT